MDNLVSYILKRVYLNRQLKVRGSVLVSAVLVLILSLVLWQMYYQNFVAILHENQLLITNLHK